MSFSNSLTVAVRARRLGRTTKWNSWWTSGKTTCRADRSRRFNLFLTTALFDNFLLTIIPALGDEWWMMDDGWWTKTPARLPEIRRPFFITSLNSSLESLNFLGSTFFYLPFLLVFTASLIRPLRRRLRKIFFPLWVEVLFLNPWALARWTLEGW